METSNVIDTESQKADHLGQDEKGSKPDLSSSSIHDIEADIELDVLNGYQSFMLVFAISLAGFLYALDVNIIVTVSIVTLSRF